MSNRDLPMMPWYPDQFAASTVAWTFAERSLYRCLLDAQWQLGRLPADPTRLANIVQMPKDDFALAWQTVRDKFVPECDGLINKRLQYHQLAAMQRKQHASTAGSAGGKASAAAKAKRGSTTAGTVAQATAQANVNPPSPSPESDKTPTPQSGAAVATQRSGTRAGGDNPRALGSNPRSNGTNPRATGTNPRAVAEEREWAPLLEKAKRLGFREPAYVETPAVYETQLRLWERDHPTGATT